MEVYVCLSASICQEQMLQTVADIGDSVKPLSNAAQGEAEKLGHEVKL